MTVIQFFPENCNQTVSIYTILGSGYILGVITLTTALDRLWGADGTLNMWF